ncbi:MAG: hypothetical protein KIS76_00210 [Pyrinomonadaceae bacterium]|nr:hypothetical protein [Pyrinomonadaceae bacterium]
MVSAVKNISKTRRSITGRLFLGVDGGGTKTSAVLINEFAEIAAKGKSGASNPVRVGIENAVANIVAAVSSACDNAGASNVRLAGATLGLAGVRREDLRDRVRERVSKSLKIENVEVVTDAEIALYGAVAEDAGLVVIAGTGSICLGKDRDGKRSSAGGWGPLAGDEGGGAGIARDALRAIARAYDSRGAKTTLTEKALTYFRAGKPDDLILAIYAPQVDNLKIAGFAKYVAEAAEEGDRIACEIMARAGSELGIAAAAVIRDLNLENTEFPIAKVGSVFNAGSLVSDPMMKKINEAAPFAYLIEPEFPPAVAAARMALRSAMIR